MKSKIRKILILLFWLFVWEAAALLVDNRFLLVTPVEVMKSLLGMVISQSFYVRFGLTFCKIGLGFFGGSLTGIVCAVLCWRHPLLKELLQPLVQCMKAVPVVSYVVILLIWFGSNGLAACICFLVVFPILYIQLLEGLEKIPMQMLELRQAYHLTKRTAFFYLYSPLMEPYIMAGLKLSLGLCWKAGVAAEVIGIAKNSIGEGLYMAKISMETGEILGWTVVMIGMSMLFERGILSLVKKGLQWQWPCRVRPYLETPTAIQCRELCKNYGEKTVLHGFTASYEPNRIYPIDWPSGTGKTTLFRVLMGFEKASLGDYEYSGRGSFLFQEDRLMEQFSALKNVEMVTGDTLSARKYLLQLLEPSDIDVPVMQLSGGMKRRVALARAMAFPADFVLLDEPFSGMDRDTRQRACRFIEEHKRGRVILLASHVENTYELEVK